MDEHLEETLNRENITVAPVFKRVLAHVVDELLMSIIIVAILWERIQSAAEIEAIVAVTNQAILEIFLLKAIYHTFFTWQYGATLGKMLLKIRIIDTQMLDTPTPLMALNRALVRTLNEFLLYFGFVFAFFDPFKRALHDRTARTLVIDVA